MTKTKEELEQELEETIRLLRKEEMRYILESKKSKIFAAVLEAVLSETSKLHILP